MGPMDKNLGVRHFTDYRAFMVHFVQQKKAENPHWSLGLWARQMGLGSTATISKVVSGQRFPGPKMIDQLISHFKFGFQEAQYFRDLIQFSKIKDDPKLAAALLDKIRQDPVTRCSKTLTFDELRSVSSWYALALREIIRTQRFFDDPKWIENLFRFPVNSSEIENCLDLMLEAGLIEKTLMGEFAVTSQLVISENDVASELIKQYHEGVLDLAKSALRQIDVNEREFQAMTLMIRDQNIEKAKVLIREFREKFATLLEEVPGEKLYQFQIQFFPITHDLAEKHNV